MKSFLLSAVICCSLSGCVDLAESIYNQHRANPELLKFQAELASLRPAAVRVESEPPGAVIEINSEAVGRTPCTISVKVLPDGNVYQSETVNAIPTQSGDFTQRKVIEHGYPAPKLIFFNMHLGPVRQTIILSR
jgi:hypothetical protein